MILRRREGAALGFQEPVEDVFKRDGRVGEPLERQLDQLAAAWILTVVIVMSHVEPFRLDGVAGNLTEQLGNNNTR